MRIRAVLRDAEILAMKPGSKERILATAMKNLDRLVNIGSLLKVMGLSAEDRILLLQILEKTELNIWLLKDNEQHLIFLSESVRNDLEGYKWK
ncbi:MAG: hypothetical protein EAX95_07620 [Candidatus Thorarchaeota archaeon]|nr:hypothetical protein [Candidatus Thorarchaeota archaeon]